MTTIESIRITRDITVKNSKGQQWERIPVTCVEIEEGKKIIESVDIKRGENGQKIIDNLCKKYGLEKRRYTNNQVI